MWSPAMHLSPQQLDDLTEGQLARAVAFAERVEAFFFRDDH